MLTDSQGREAYTATSNANGIVRFPDVSNGTYTLLEKSAPKGYVASDETYTLTVSDSRITMNGKDYAPVTFVNRKAAELGMTGTSFANPNGLDQEGHYSTARDMARLAACAVKNETLVRLCSTRSVTVGGRTMTNHNRLLRSIDGCIGLKTGYTRAAGRTLVSCVRRNGRTLVAVTLQDGNDWADHAALYEFGFGP